MSRIAGLKPKFQIKRGNRIGVVYEDGAGWHTELSHDRLFEESAEMNAALSQAKQALSQYVNRRGEDPPRGATIGVLALWLMQKLTGQEWDANLAVKVNRSDGLYRAFRT